MIHGRIMLVPFTVALANACGEVAETTRGIVRDSAGIAIIENVGPVWLERDRWRLSSEPMLDIGVLEGASEYELFDTRSALRLADGRIAVANNGTKDVRFFDGHGRFLGSEGRDGGGPREFRTLSALLRWRGDSLAAYDQRLRRLSILDSAGVVRRTASVARNDRTFFPQIFGVVVDGSFLGQRLLRGRGPDLPTGVSRDTLYIYRFSSDGVLRDTLGVFAHRSNDNQMRDVGGRRFPIPVVIPFSPHTVVAARQDGIVVAESDRYEIGVYDFDGRLTRLIRKETTLEAITADHHVAFMDQLRERFHGQLDNPEIKHHLQFVEKAPLPPTFPVLDSLVVDSEQHLWVSHFRKPGIDRNRWDVFDPDGSFLGQLDVPVRFRPTDIGDDYVLGIWTDELEIVHVRMYGLLKEQ